MNFGNSNENRVVQPRKQFGWRKAIKIAGGGILLILLAVFGFSGALWLKYRSIVSARPGQLQTGVQPGELGRWVNPFSGTGGFPWMCGNNFPGAMVPFGMVRLGPETSSLLLRKRALNTSGYFYGDEQMIGFSHTRLNGTGATDGGHFLVMPARGPMDPKQWQAGQSTRFSHSEEVASPGYYAVKLPKLDTLVELTATPRVGVHRYTFAKGATPHVWLDVMNALGGRRSAEGKVRVLPEKGEVEGEVRTFGTFASRYGGLKVYFVARFDQALAAHAIWQDETLRTGLTAADGGRLGVDLSFVPTGESTVLTLKLAISHVSVANARENLEFEAGAKDFNAVLADAQQLWEDRLGSIKIQGGTAKQRRIFYTALYRVFQMPTLFNDVNGEYIGFDRQIHRADGFQYFTDLSLWDTFRTTHPLYTLVAPAEQRSMMVSLVRMAEQGGWLPRWPSGHGYSNSMLGTPADIVIAEAYLKGIRDFDIERAFQAMRQTALAPPPPGAAFSGREGVEHYLRYGYCPSDLMEESVARTLEFAWADSAIANLAEALGKSDDAKLFREHAQSYRSLWNANTQYFQPRDVQGKFFEPFKPMLLTYLDRGGKYTRAYVEGSALQWRWGVPHDGAGLISLFRSCEFFVTELNDFFAKSNPAMGRWNPGPYYWHGNQPDIHAAYLFNEAGRPDLTQKWVRWILDNKYADDYIGLDGNDDGGTLSAWYVLSALGLYPVAGSDRYELGAPLFERAEVRMGERTLVIIADNHAANHAYVRNVGLNNVPLDRYWFGHAEIAAGGVLEFTMTDQPVTSVVPQNLNH